MALEDFLTTEMVMLDKVSRPDGYGGITYEWQEGAAFKAGIARQNSSALQVAQLEGMAETFSVVVKENVPLEREGYIRRVKDGATMRITSSPEDGTPPNVSTIRCIRVFAERVSI